MLKYLIYPVFGLTVIGGYAGVSAMGSDITSTTTHRSNVPAQHRGPGLAAAPIIWHTGFHGPSRYYSSGSSSGGGSYGGGRTYGGGYYGGK